MRIVICEDDPIHAMTLEMILEEESHEVAGVFSRADDALLHCWKQAPDLVLLDLNLADGPTGLSLAHAFSKMNIPVIIVGGEGTRAMADVPARVVLPKPWAEQLLIDAIAAVH